MNKISNSTRLLAAIENDCEAIARLLQTCGSSRNFGVEQRHQLERLLRHRRQLMNRLENFRKAVAHRLVQTK